MSGTRSPSRKGPVTEALIVSHGQPSSPEEGEVQLKVLADRVRQQLPGWEIRSATLAAPDVFDQELAACCGEPFVYPVFMADGWFTKKALPKHLNGRKVHQLCPLGLHPGLPHRTVKLLKREAEQRGWTLSSCNIIIAAHGSETGPAAADCALYFAKRVRSLMPFKKKIHTGFLAQEPFLSLVAQVSTDRTLLLPFLAGTGSHLTEDIPQALAEGGFRGVQLPAIGEADFIADLIAHSLSTARQRTGNFDPLSQPRTTLTASPGGAAASEAHLQDVAPASGARSEQSDRRSFPGIGLAASLFGNLGWRRTTKKRQAA